MKPRPSALSSRIRRLMLADDDVGKVAAATPGVIERALELFLDRLIKAAGALMAERGDKMLTAGHFKAVAAADPVFDFCKPLLAAAPDLPDAGGGKKKKGGGGSCDAGAKRKAGGGGGGKKKAKKDTDDDDDDDGEAEDDNDDDEEVAAAEAAAPVPAPPAAPAPAPPAAPVEDAAAAAATAPGAAAPPDDDDDVVPMPPLDNAADYVQFEDDFDA